MAKGDAHPDSIIYSSFYRSAAIYFPVFFCSAGIGCTSAIIHLAKTRRHPDVVELNTDPMPAAIAMLVIAIVTIIEPICRFIRRKRYPTVGALLWVQYGSPMNGWAILGFMIWLIVKRHGRMMDSPADDKVVIYLFTGGILSAFMTTFCMAFALLGFGCALSEERRPGRRGTEAGAIGTSG